MRAVRRDAGRSVTVDGSVILIALVAVVGLVAWAVDRFSELSVESAVREAEAESRAPPDAKQAAI
jgi:hypothetical protein